MSFPCFSLPLGSFLTKQKGNTVLLLSSSCGSLHKTVYIPLAFACSSQAGCPCSHRLAPSFPGSAATCCSPANKRALGLQASQRSSILCACVCSRESWEAECSCPLRQAADISNSEQLTRTKKQQPTDCFISSTWLGKFHLQGDNSVLEAPPAVRFFSCRL